METSHSENFSKRKYACEYLTYKEWKLNHANSFEPACPPVSTLPIRNGNETHRPASVPSPNREYLTYKEWKREVFHISAQKLLWREYLTYKEWKLISCFISCFISCV